MSWMVTYTVRPQRRRVFGMVTRPHTYSRVFATREEAQQAAFDESHGAGGHRYNNVGVAVTEVGLEPTARFTEVERTRRPLGFNKAQARRNQVKAVRNALPFQRQVEARLKEGKQ